jgi:hypothetical protein
MLCPPGGVCVFHHGACGGRPCVFPLRSSHGRLPPARVITSGITCVRVRVGVSASVPAAVVLSLCLRATLRVSNSLWSWYSPSSGRAVTESTCCQCQRMCACRSVCVCLGVCAVGARVAMLVCVEAPPSFAWLPCNLAITCRHQPRQAFGAPGEVRLPGRRASNR